MINKSIIQKLSDKQMDRKDFLKYSGILLASAVGLKGILTVLGTIDLQPKIVEQSKVSRGFGGGKYGL